MVYQGASERMCKRRFGVAWVLLILGLGTACAATAAPVARLYIATEIAQPTSTSGKGQTTGIVTEKIRTALERSGVDFEIKPLPWQRAYATALARPDGCVYPTTRTAERESKLKWVGPIAEAAWVMMARADRRIKLDSLEQARKMRIGTYHGDARDQFLRERGFNVDAASNDLLNIPKLLQGRIDLWAASVRADLSPPLPGLDSRIVPILTFHRSQIYLACNRAVPDAVIAQINAQLEAMARDGTSRRIEREHQQAGAVSEPSGAE